MRLRLIGFVVGGFLAAVAPASAEVQLSIQNGRVTLIAQDATVREILTEWAKVGQAKIINLERISGGPLTLQLTNLPELQALDIVLRSVSGYIAAPRQTAISNTSLFDRIVVLTMAHSAAPARPSTPQQAPTFMPPEPFQQSDHEPATPDRLPDAAAAPFSQYTQPQFVTPQAPAFPTAAPGVPSQQAGIPAPRAPQSTAPAGVRFPGAPNGAPLGVSIPGTMVPVPQVQPPGQVAPQNSVPPPTDPQSLTGTPAPRAPQSAAPIGVPYPGAPSGVPLGVPVPGMMVSVPQVQQPPAPQLSIPPPTDPRSLTPRTDPRPPRGNR